MPSFSYVPPGATEPVHFNIERRLTTIGSAPDNDLVIAAPETQDHHALVQFDGQSFSILAASRSSVVFINGKKRKKQALAHQDKVNVGGLEMTFKLLDEAAPQADMKRINFELESLHKLHRFSQKMLDEYDVEVLLEALMDAVIDLTQADKGFLVLANDEDFEIRVARSIDAKTIEDADGQLSDSIIRKVIAQRHPIIVSDALHHSEFQSAQSVINLKLNSVMCVPLLHKGELIGVIYVGNESIVNLFTHTHLQLLTVFASQASLVLANAVLVNDLKGDNAQLNRRLDEMKYGSIIGACDAMREVFNMIEKVAPTNVNVLVLGDTGTGKELIANELHNRSPRAQGPFVTINCGAIPENLLESELFGHVRGAFTGASSTRQGKFQAAHNGTIFLDEIGELQLDLQVKLLRVLQERTITKVGATKPEKVDIRVIAATNRQLEEAVRMGTFREDLYYRLNVVQMVLPPLNQRGQDVILIARYLIRTVCEDMGMGLKRLGPEAEQAMLKYAWPGNIRQLENRLKKAVVLSDTDVLTPEDLDLPPEVLQDILPLNEAKERFAYRYIMEALERHGNNRTQTAKELGVDPRTIFRYLEKEWPDA